LGAAAVGRAYVFTKTATGWKQAAELDAGENSGGEGSAVASSGTVAVVGGVVTCLFEV
jgi:phosphoribosylamine-glycine ligase